MFFRNGWYNRQPKNWAVNLKRIKHSLENNFTRRRILATSIAILAALTLSSCWFERETVTRNIRVIIQAEVAGKIVEGSAVMGIRWVPGDNGRMYIRSNIEAVILNLPERGTVYVLNAWIGSDGRQSGGYWPAQVKETFGVKANGHLRDFPMLRELKGKYQVMAHPGGPSNLPVMVSFRDEARRETMFHVKPEDFSTVFGNDVRFLGMWFEFTNEEPTTAIVGRLPIMMGRANSSYREFFPLRGDDGNLISFANKAFPQRFGKSVFYFRGY